MAHEGLLAAVEQGTAAFDEALLSLDERSSAAQTSVEPAVRQIVNEVQHAGDAAVRRYAERLEGKPPAALLERPFEGEAALLRQPREVAQVLRSLAGKLQRFHQRQREASFSYEEGGMTVGQRVRPVRRAAICAPGPRTRSALGVLLSAMPARVAGVSDLILATPFVDDLTRAAAHLAGVTALVHAGGAQAVAALAFGTASIPRVDVIAGDCDLYGACAKRLVFGRVQVDGPGGPPELLALADASAQPALVAADLLALAEADEGSHPLLLTTERRLLASVQQELARQLGGMPRRAVASAALERNGRALIVRQREQMLEVAERIAPAQAVFHVERPEDAFDRLRSLGAGAWGALTPGSGGLLGGSLPTGGGARFWGPVGVNTFMARTCHLRFGAVALRAQADGLALLGRTEGREALARSLEQRLGLPEASERRG